ncbi:MAG TPA: hypothetical protein VMT89_04555, partial [Candidatus Acidoferrales bacterium]|nr:hypothetical protein [Candidatus Acidoferrales bacterium]
LNHGPIRDVTACFWWYPGTAPGSSWTIQPTWQRIDYQFGRFDTVPADGPLMQMLSLNAFVLSSIAGGRSVPQSIFVDYTAGFTKEIIAGRLAYLLKGVRLRTMLGLMGVVSTIASNGQTGGSLGLDGMSESKSFGGKWGAFSGAVELALRQEDEIRELYKAKTRGTGVSFA